MCEQAHSSGAVAGKHDFFYWTLPLKHPQKLPAKQTLLIPLTLELFSAPLQEDGQRLAISQPDL